MIIFKKVADLKTFLKNQPAYPAKTGFVPTMGALHQGHLELLSNCRRHMEISVVSIFVNPTQFNDLSDFKNYPVTIESDILKLEKAGCDILFLPSVEEVYDKGVDEEKHYALGNLESLLEGYYRPGHFQGVCKVMDKLLHIVLPGHLYMGSKDYQQCMVIKRLIDISKLAISFHMVDTVREADGLAMSSRNLRLSEADREKAVSIFRQFGYIKENIHRSAVSELQDQAADNLLKSGFTKVDYVSIADPDNLEPLNSVSKAQRVRVLIAAFLGPVRLIDNMEIIA